MKKTKVFIGTSGYNYKHWGGGVFYPENLPSTQWLNHYTAHFKTVELNVTFYRLPGRKTFAGWHRQTPAGFSFAIKGNRFITHLKKLKDSKDSLRIFFRNASALKEKLSVVLWQLPANFHLNLERLDEFSTLLTKNPLGKKVRQAFEFRHLSWFCPEVYSILRKHNFSLCLAHSSRWPMVEIAAADFVYLRFHGGAVLYGSNYSEKELKEWAVKAKGFLEEGKDIYAYFNNDTSGYAVKNAKRFRELLED